MSNLRLMGTPEEVANLLKELNQYFTVTGCREYPCRGTTDYIRLYADIKGPEGAHRVREE